MDPTARWLTCFLSPSTHCAMKPSLLFAVITAFPLLTAAKATVNDVINQLESSQSPLLQYATQLTQNIVPKPIHSHNDCELTIAIRL